VDHGQPDTETCDGHSGDQAEPNAWSFRPLPATFHTRTGAGSRRIINIFQLMQIIRAGDLSG